MDNKGVKEMLNTFSHEGNANKVTGRTRSWLCDSADKVFVLQICGKDFHPKNPLIISELGRQRQAREGWT